VLITGPPITTFYRLTIVSLYRHLYTKCIQIAYNISYKGSLDFGIPGVLPTKPLTPSQLSTYVQYPGE